MSTQAQQVFNKQVAPVSLGSTFVAGLDPTGTYTFGLAQRAKRDKQHLAAGLAGGLIGGATIVPTAVGSGIQLAKSLRGLKKMPTLRGKGAYLLQQAYRGGLSPWKQLYHGLKGKSYINKALASGQIDDLASMEHNLRNSSPQLRKQLRDLKATSREYAATGAAPESVIRGGRVADKLGYGQLADRASKSGERLTNYAKGVDSNVMDISSRADKKSLKDLRTNMSSRLGNVIAGIGASAALGGGSAYLQYNQGRQVGDRLRAAGVDLSKD